MIRRVVTYLLILTVAAGPMLCCCSAGYVHSAPVLGKVLSAGGAAEQPSEAAHSCCSHRHRTAARDDAQKPQQTKPAPQQPAKKCPCKDKDSADKTKAAPTESAAADVAALLHLAQFADAGPVPVPAFVSPCAQELKCSADPRRGPGAAGLSTDQLLFAHHNLRC